MTDQPAPAHRPKGTGAVVDGFSVPPNVHIVVGDPTGVAIHVTCGLPTVDGQFFDGFKKGLLAFGEVGHFGGPIVHLGIDVDGVCAVPGWRQLVVPNALQVKWLASGTGTRNHQVAAILKIQGSKRRILTIRKQFYPPIRGQPGLLGFGRQLDLHPFEQVLIIQQMLLVQGSKGFVLNAFETCVQQFCRVFTFVSGAFVKTVVTGCSTQHNDQLGGILHPNFSIHIADRSTRVDHFQAAFKGHAEALDLLIVQEICCFGFSFPGFFVQFGVLVLVAQFFHQIEITA